MVSRKTDQSKTLKKKNSLAFRVKLVISLLFLGISVTLFTFILCFLIGNQFYTGNLMTFSEQKEDNPTVEEPVKEYQKIDFQPVIDTFTSRAGGNKSVLIYDLERDEMVGEYNPDESYGTASLYKLFVVYEGYRRLESGEWQASDRVASTGYSTIECLDLAIRESYSPCAEALWDKIGRDELDTIIKDNFKISNSDILRLISNPKDILAMMKLFYYHKDITDETLLARMKDSFLNQPETTYDWRQGLPSGFSKAKVYNKVGWDYNPKIKNWNIYHDAAIVELPKQERHFIVVVMSNRVPFQKIRQFGTEIENHFLKNYQ